MKKQAMMRKNDSLTRSVGTDKLSRVLLIVAIILYSASLVLLANLAMASETLTYGALIKVNNRLDGNAFASVDARVKSVHGNVLALDLPAAKYVLLNNIEGVCAGRLDMTVNTKESKTDPKSFVAKYAGANVVVGILDNTGALSKNGKADLKKIESESNVGFIAYLSDDPNSTVIMRNLVGGESNLVQALAYMQAYAKTVEKPLIVELILSGEEMNNPLFIQVCQKIADAGVQFVGADLGMGYVNAKAPIQLAFSMFSTQTGKMTDVSDFWAISEVKNQEIMLLGSDENTCRIHFQTEAGFEKIYLSNSSNDEVMVTVLNAKGEVSYYHVINKETALIPRELRNGTSVLEDGLAGVYPYHSKMAMFNGTVATNQFVALSKDERKIELTGDSNMSITIGSPSAQTLAMSLSELHDDLRIEILDENGEVIYLNEPDEETQSIQTRIDLSEGAGGLYFLDLTSPQFHQTFALQMD